MAVKPERVETCDYCGETLPEGYPRHECPVCWCQACAECSCGRGTAHFDCAESE